MLAETVPEWLYADMGTLGAGGVTNGIYPTDSAKQVDYIVNDSRSRFLFVENEEQLDKFLEVRERCPSLAKVVVFDMEGLADFNDPMIDASRRADGARPRVRQRIPATWEQPRRGVRGRRAGAAGLHLGYDRTAQGRDDLAPQRDLPAAQRRRLHPARQRRRAARLPAALPHRRAHLHDLSAAEFRRDRQLRRELETVPANVREVAPTTVLRRAAHLGALLFRHRHPHEGGDLDRPHRLPVGDRHRAQGRRGRARRPHALAGAEARLPPRRLAGARQHQAGDRHASHQVRRHRRRADRARSDQVVPRARRRHARGLRPDRELRRGDRHAQPHQARHGRHHRAQHRAEDLARGRDPAARARTSLWAT